MGGVSRVHAPGVVISRAALPFGGAADRGRNLAYGDFRVIRCGECKVNSEVRICKRITLFWEFFRELPGCSISVSSTGRDTGHAPILFVSLFGDAY